MENISYVGSLVKMLLALGVVLAMMVGTVYLLRKLMGRTALGADDADVIKILATKSLGPRSSIMIIETLGKVSVIGISGGQMNLLTEIDDADALARIRELKRRGAPAYPGLPIDALRDKIMKSFKRK